MIYLASTEEPKKKKGSRQMSKWWKISLFKKRKKIKQEGGGGDSQAGKSKNKNGTPSRGRVFGKTHQEGRKGYSTIGSKIPSQ